MDPLDDVVADVHGVGAFREQVDAEGAGRPASGLEGLIPPARAFDESLANEGRRATIDVVLERRDGDAGVRAVRILLDEAMADDELLVEWLAEGRVVVAPGGGEIAGAGREAARGKAGRRQLDEGLVLADGHGAWIRCDVLDKAGRRAGRFFAGDEGELGFDFRVFGEGAGGVESDGGTRGIDVPGALGGASERFDDVVDVAEEELRGIDEDGSVWAFGVNRESSEDGRRKRLRDGELGGGVGGGGAESGVGLDEEELVAGALEVDEDAFGDLAAVEANVVGAHTPRERVGIDVVSGAGVVGAGEGDFEVELAGFGVPVERQQAGVAAQGGDARCEGLRPCGRGGSLRAGGGGGEDEREDCGWKLAGASHLLF